MPSIKIRILENFIHHNHCTSSYSKSFKSISLELNLLLNEAKLCVLYPAHICRRRERVAWHGLALLAWLPTVYTIITTRHRRGGLGEETLELKAVQCSAVCIITWCSMCAESLGVLSGIVRSILEQSIPYTPCI